jgi:hypothetical protein
LSCVGDFCNEPSRSVNGGKFLHHFGNYYSFTQKLHIFCKVNIVLHLNSNDLVIFPCNTMNLRNKLKILPVVEFPADTALEEAAAPVACKDAVMLPRAGVSTHNTRQAQRRLVLRDSGW